MSMIKRVLLALLIVGIGRFMEKANAQAFAANTGQPGRNGAVSQASAMKPLSAALRDMEARFGVQFVYKTDEIPNQVISLDTRSGTLEEMLESVLCSTELTYKKVRNTYIIRKREISRKLTEWNTAPVNFIPTDKAASDASAEEIIVSGRVTEENGQALLGVTVLAKGTDQGTTTDDNGTYKISVPDDKTVLVFSFVGYLSQEITVGGQSQINLTLVPDNKLLNEVVVVGYGTQQKSAVTGAINQVGSDVLQNRPVLNIAQGIQGAVPNLNVSFGDGKPGRGGNFNVRGFTSINGGEPLILVDGVAGNINLINPEDVESVTVLKDAASSAIYGARAAFGVVIVTTKKGQKDKPVFRCTSNFGWSSPTRLPKVIDDPLAAAEVQNLAYRNYAGSDQPGMPAVIEYLKLRRQNPNLPELGVDASGNFIRGANTDWYGKFYKKTQPYQKHYLSASGGTEKTTYFLSLGYQHQGGAFAAATDNYNQYSFRSNVSCKLTKWLEISNRTEFNQGMYDAPNKFVNGGFNVYRYLSLFANPYEAIYTPNGNYTQAGMLTFGALTDGGRTKETDRIARSTLKGTAHFFKNKLMLNGDYTLFLTQNINSLKVNRLKYESNPNVISNYSNPDYYQSYFDDNLHQIINLYAEYNEKWNEHAVKALAGFNQELNQFSGVTARRDQNILREGNSLNLTSGTAAVSDKKSEWALRGLFYRLNYEFMSKYLLEMNGRYDGTSRFPKDKRFGFFPSVSVGWIVSNEKFLTFANSWMDQLKLRASYGSLGNQLVSNYAYTNTMAIAQTTNVLDGTRPLGTKAPGLNSQNLTWEEAITLNLGVDAAFLSNRLSIGLDWYRRDTKGMLTKSATLPAVLGTTAPKVNAADLRTSGWELSVTWSDQVMAAGKPLRYDCRAVLSDNKTVITRYNNPTKSLTDYYEGMRVGEIWGYETLGFFDSNDEYQTHADQRRVQSFIYGLNGHPLAGDIKFNDRNSDKIISAGTNTVDAPGDMRIIGNSSPRYAYGFTLNTSWNGIGVSVFIQGIGMRQFWPGSESGNFWGFYNRWNQPVYQHIYGNYWTPENRDAYFPRPVAYEALSDNRELGVAQTRYLQDASYTRLKNLTLSYDIPAAVIKRAAGLRQVKFFFSGQNLMEWTKLSAAFDPEAIGDEADGTTSNGKGFVYPIQRSYTVGLDINF